MHGSALLRLLIPILLIAGCGAWAAAAGTPAHATPAAPALHVVALVTDETQDRLLVVDPAAGKVLARIPIGGAPQYVASTGAIALVSGPASGTVSVLAGNPLRVVRILGGFAQPRLVAIAPDGRHAFVTDDAAGTLTAIDLATDRITSRVHVGAGAHHLALSPDQRRLWVALTESARTIVILDTRSIGHPRVLGSFDPGYAAHDLSFSADGRRVWITSASGSDVGVFDAATRRLLFKVPVGPPPQHISMQGPYVYLTSGYGSAIERVQESSGRILERSRAPYGSFELDAAGGYVVTASLLNGELAVYTPQLRLLRTLALAPATRDVELAP